MTLETSCLAAPVAKRSGRGDAGARPRMSTSSRDHGDTRAGAGQLRTFWEAWKRWARRVADAQARILLTVFYYSILMPFALFLRWRSDPLAIKPGTAKGWRTRIEPAEAPLERARRQF